MVAEFILSQQQLLGAGAPLGPAPSPSRAPPPPRSRHDSMSPHYMDGPPPPGCDPYDNSNSFDFNKQRKEFFGQRKQREFIPDNKKDDGYWDRRRRNNEAAKRSREKRRFNDMVLEQRVVELSKENHVMKAQLDAIKEKYGICGEALISIDQVLATLPTCDQVLCVTKRSKLSPSNGLFPPAPPPPPPAQPASPPSPPPQRAPEPYQERLPAPETYYNHPAHYEPPGSVLNLSRSRRAPSPYELSSLSGSGDETAEHYAPENNCLPLKLRHKSHLGDKDVASALLSLQHIKQEPGPRSSPSWDGEGSSDERDSGISLGAEYRPQQDRMGEEEDAHLKAELARLATEVATLKNMMHQNKARAHEH